MTASLLSPETFARVGLELRVKTLSTENVRAALARDDVEGWRFADDDATDATIVIDDAAAGGLAVWLREPDGVRGHRLTSSDDVNDVAAAVRILAWAYASERRARAAERARDALISRVEQQQQALRTAMSERGLHVLRGLEHERRLDIERSTQAAHDAGTGLVRVGRFRQRLAFEIERSLRTGDALALLLVDVDDMARINATHGYDAGDELLQRIARSLPSIWVAREALRPPILGRDVGDCIAIALPCVDDAAAQDDAERVRALVQRLLFGGSRATVSVGVASWRAGLDREALLRLARGAMTEAYRQGGNRVSAAVTT